MKFLRLYSVAIAMSSCLLLHAQDDAGLQVYSHYDEPLIETYQITYSDDFAGDDLFMEENLGDLNHQVFDSDWSDVYSSDDEAVLIDSYAQDEDLYSFGGGYVGDDDLYVKKYYYADQIEAIESSEDDFIFSENIGNTSADLSSDKLGFYSFTEQEEVVGYYDNLEVDRISQESEEYIIDEVVEDHHIIYPNRCNSYDDVGDFFLEATVYALVMLLLGD